MGTRFHVIEAREAGLTLLEWLQSQLRLPRQLAMKQLNRRFVRVNGTPCSNPAWRLRAGQRIEVGPTSPNRDIPSIVIRYIDEAVVIVEKPAGLTTMRHAEEAAEFGARAKKYLPLTLAEVLPQQLAAQNRGKPVPVRAVHRLDRDTTGLLVFARNPEAERHLGRQFREHSIERSYLAIVRGQAQSARLESWLVRDRGDGRRGSSKHPGEGQRAVTEVEVIEPLGSFTLVRCRLQTGRTHQVRIHLGEAGTPLCGEKVYDRPLHGRPLPDTSRFSRPALHAASLGFTHPFTGEWRRWTSELPADMAKLLETLRKNKRSI